MSGFVGHDDFTVEPAGAELKRLQSLRQSRESRGPVVAVAADQPHLVALETRAHAVTVELDLVQPLLAAGRLRSKRRELRRNEVGQSRPRRLSRATRTLSLHADAFGLLREDAIAIAGTRCVVIDLAQQPFIGTTAHAQQQPLSAQLLTVQSEVQLSSRQPFCGIPAGLPRTPVPQQHVASTIFTGGDRALECAVLERMILRLHCKPACGWIEARTLRNGPALQYAVPFEAEVVVQATRSVPLDAVLQRLSRARAALARGFRRATEVALAPVLAQRARAVGWPHLRAPSSDPNSRSRDKPHVPVSVGRPASSCRVPSRRARRRPAHRLLL